LEHVQQHRLIFSIQFERVPLFDEERDVFDDGGWKWWWRLLAIVKSLDLADVREELLHLVVLQRNTGFPLGDIFRGEYQIQCFDWFAPFFAATK
jgi:hypothetical protein